MITLWAEADCTSSSLHHFWRNDPGITPLIQPQARPINLNVSSLFHYSLQEMNDYLEKLDISTQNPTAIEGIEKTIDFLSIKEFGVEKSIGNAFKVIRLSFLLHS